MELQQVTAEPSEFLARPFYQTHTGKTQYCVAGIFSGSTDLGRCSTAGWRTLK